MGSFYVNVCVQSASNAELVEFVRSRGDRAYVSRAVGGWVCVTTQKIDTQDGCEIDGFSSAVSSLGGGSAISVLNHDDGFLLVQLFQEGKEVAFIDTCPGYFDEAPTSKRLKPKVSAGDAFLKFANGKSLEDLLALIVNQSVFAIETHQELSRFLGLPELSVQAGYEYFRREEFAGNPEDWTVID